MNYTMKSKQHSSEANGNAADNWTSFCDFPEITLIDITESNVRISTQNNHCMVSALVCLLMYEMKYIRFISKWACDASVTSITISLTRQVRLFNV